MRIVRRLFAVTVREVLLLEVVGADAEQRVGDEFVERYTVEVVAVAAEPARQPAAVRFVA